MGFPIFGSTGTTYVNHEKSFNGVTLYTTFGADRVNLIDLDGNVVHTWSPPAPLKPYNGFMRGNVNLSLRCQSGEEKWQFGGASATIPIRPSLRTSRPSPGSTIRKRANTWTATPWSRAP